jgi:hypothetical protein
MFYFVSIGKLCAKVGELPDLTPEKINRYQFFFVIFRKYHLPLHSFLRIHCQSERSYSSVG